MGEHLEKRLQQKHFKSSYHEALLNILVCADYIEREQERICAVYDITAAQYNVLRILRGVYPEGHPRCDIITRMVHDAPDVTRLIDRLIKGGFASRGKSDADGRLSLTYITQQGLDLLEKMQVHIDNVERSLSERLSEDDAKKLSQFCESIYGRDDEPAPM